MWFRRVMVCLAGCLALVAGAAGTALLFGGLPVATQLASVVTIGDSSPGATFTNWRKRAASRPLTQSERVALLFRVPGKAARADLVSARSFEGDSLFGVGEIAELRRRDVLRDLESLGAQVALGAGGAVVADQNRAPLTLITPPALAWHGDVETARKRRHAAVVRPAKAWPSMPLPVRVRR